MAFQDQDIAILAVKSRLIILFFVTLSGMLPGQTRAGTTCGTTPCIDSADIIDGQVKAADIANGAVGTTKLKANAVNSAKVLDGSLTGADIQNGSVTRADIEPTAHRVVVATSGGDYTSISAALGAISPSVTDPYVIDVMPGIYTENITMKSYVHPSSFFLVIRSPEISPMVLLITPPRLRLYDTIAGTTGVGMYNVNSSGGTAPAP